MQFAHSVLDSWINSECFNKQFVFVVETLCVFCGVGIGGLNTRIYEIHAPNGVTNRNACENYAPALVWCMCQESVGEVLAKCCTAYTFEQTNAGCLFKLVGSVLNKILVLTVCAAVCCSWCKERLSFVA